MTRTGIHKSYHPVLQELQLVEKGDHVENRVTALEILNHMLETNILTTEAIRSAHDALRRSQQQRLSTTKLKGDEEDRNTKTISEEEMQVNRIRKRHIALRFYYDGAGYTGLAQNIGKETDNSVERALFQALCKTKLIESRETSGYSRCGRTDKGVSAAGQVVALHLKSAIPLDAAYDAEGNVVVPDKDLPKNELDSLKIWVFPRNKKDKQKSSKHGPENGNLRQEREISEYAYAKILNNVLPADIRILGWAPVTVEFSARFSATTRTYRYFFVRRQMDLCKIRRGLELLVGKHDFRNFCKMDVEKVYNFERLIHEASLIELSEGVCYLQILGQAFLWHQIRCITEVLFMIGRGLEEPSVISALLDVERYPGKPAYPLAPERPLVLHNCQYDNLQVGYSVQNLWTVSCQMEQQWEELILAAARIRNSIESLKEVFVIKKDLKSFAVFKMKERSKKQRQNAGSDIMDPLRGGERLDDTSISNLISWKETLEWLHSRGLVPDSNGLATSSYHIPLLQRSKGTTYEQKVDALQNSEKRRQKYEENVIKKRKTKEEDAAFYEHMTKQGGTAM